MTISEAIISLQKLQSKYGDVEIIDVTNFVKSKYKDINTNNKWCDAILIENEDIS